MKRKVLSLVLVIILVFTVLCIPVSAEVGNSLYVKTITAYPVFLENGKYVYHYDINATSLYANSDRDFVNLWVPASIYNLPGIQRWRIEVRYYTRSVHNVSIAVDYNTLYQTNGPEDESALSYQDSMLYTFHVSSLDTFHTWSFSCLNGTTNQNEIIYARVEKDE